jgi:uncharacterized membrane protein
MNHSKRYQNTYFLVGLIILASILAWRLVGRDLWYDEVFSLRVVELDYGNMWQLIKSDVHPPLYYLLVKILTWPFNYSPESVRLVSLLAHLAAIGIFYQLTRKLTNKRVGYLATSIFALNPFFIGYATEARMYSLLTLLVILAAYYLIKDLQSTSQVGFTKNTLFFGIFLALAYLTHYFGALAALTFLPIIILADYQKNRSLGEAFLHLVRLYLIPGITFLAFLPFLLFQLDSDPGIYWIPEVSLEILTRSFAVFLYGLELGVLGLPPLNDFWFFVDPLLILAGAFYLLGRAKEKKIFNADFALPILVFLPLALVYLLSKFTNYDLYIERYLEPFGAFFVILISLVLTKTCNKKFLSLIIGIYLISIISFGITRKVNTDIQDLTELLKNNYPRQTIVVTDPFNYTAFDAYFNERQVYLYDYYDPENDFQGWQIIPREDVVNDLNTISFEIMLISKEPLNDFEPEVIDFDTNLLIYRLNAN